MKSILFVDDEQPLLDGLRDLLRKERRDWHMVFVNSGPNAMSALEREPFDVLISDMRMPGIDGATLLQWVREHFPRTARVILSGQSSQEELIRGIPAMQQFLGKPCDPRRLKEAVQRLCRVQELLGNESIRAAIGALDRLPSFPGCYQELVMAAARSDCGEALIAGIVERDPALSVRVLQLANSVHYRVGRPVASVRNALRFVGLDTLKALALSSQIFGALDASTLRAEPLRSLPERSLLKAQLAREFVADRALAEEAFTTALLLDIGQIVLASCCKEPFLRALAAAMETGRSQQDLEREYCAVTHSEVGAYFLALWGLPATIVDIVACHHSPTMLPMPASELVVAIHAADALVDATHAGSDDPQQALDPQLRNLPEVMARVPDWHAKAESAVATLMQPRPAASLSRSNTARIRGLSPSSLARA